MRIKVKKRYVAAAVLNVAVLVTAAVLTAVGSSLAKRQSWNYAAEEWAGESGGSCVQMSCYFSDDAEFSTLYTNTVYGQMLEELKTVDIVPKDGKVLVPTAYSTPVGIGNVSREETSASVSADVTAVGGDFFLFRDFRLIDGSFFSERDIMHDGAVIDRDLAWSLFGSDMVSGMDILLDGRKLYISGVIDTPQTDEEKECAGEKPKIYVSYDMTEASGMEQAEFPDGEMPLSQHIERITCYEFILPEPVEDFAENTADKIFSEQYEGKVDIVNNTERFNPKSCAKKYRKLYRKAVKDDAVKCPYWENASRIAEFRLSKIYYARRLLWTVPILTAAVLIIKVRIFLKQKKQNIRRAVGKLFSKLKAMIKKPSAEES